MLRLRGVDLGVLNSLTKYPSIPTYHTLDRSNGDLLEETVPFDPTYVVRVTEKVDGANARIIVLPSGEWLLGSREELLTASGDVVANPKLGIVDVLRPHAEVAAEQVTGFETIVVIYGEVFGRGVGSAARDYFLEGQGRGFRVFDVAEVPTFKLELTRAQAASWRDNGGQRFADQTALRWYASCARAALVPELALLPAGEVGLSELPKSVEDTLAWLESLETRSRVADDGARGRWEGAVLRGRSPEGRRQLAKARFEDYRRTLRRREQPAKAPRGGR